MVVKLIAVLVWVYAGVVVIKEAITEIKNHKGKKKFVKSTKREVDQILKKVEKKQAEKK